MECGHIVLMSPPVPDVNELQYCYRCGEYSVTAPAKAVDMTISYYDGWRSTPIGHRRYQGDCLHNGCAYEHREHNWYRLRDHMERHILREHVGAMTATDEIARKVREAERVPLDGKPPF